jgi:2-hydroxycyclohexanecarboxyl-CoA dehydrogenase
MTDKPLAGKTAFVTGSGRGLGRAFAERLASMGADIALHDLNWTASSQYGEAADLGVVRDEVAQKYGVRVTAVTGNIGDRVAVPKMREDIERDLGQVDILVNCAGGDIAAAGGKPDPNTALDIKMEDVEALVNSNLMGTILMCKTFVPGMRERRQGTVINITSVAAHKGGARAAIYGTLKAAIVHYTRCLADELQTFNVRVNALSPGMVKTARFTATRVVNQAKMEATDTLDRYAETDEIADALAFLAGPDSRFVHGQVLRVDGGSTLFPG